MIPVLISNNNNRYQIGVFNVLGLVCNKGLNRIEINSLINWHVFALGLGGSRPSSRPASRANSDLSTESLEGFRRRTPSASSATGTRIPTRRTPSMTRQKSDLQAREKGWR